MAFAGRKAVVGARIPSPPQPSESPSIASATTLESIPSRSARAKLHLLNPMSLLTRRSTSQQSIPLVPSSPIAPISPVESRNSNAFDPSIRGTKVHDFDHGSLARRNVSYGDVEAAENQAKPLHASPSLPQLQLGQTFTDIQLTSWSGHHTPVFTEDFDEQQYPASGPHVRKASDLADLELPKPPFAAAARPQSSPISVDAKQVADELCPPAMIRSHSGGGPPVPPKSPKYLPATKSEMPVDARQCAPFTSESSPQRSTAADVRTRSRNVSGASTKEFLLNGHSKPKHMKSTSSRFSFDVIGAAKQEKLLEDRHRQKELEKQGSTPAVDNGEFDDFDYDNGIDDDGGFEERIPGVNADFDGDEDEYITNLDAQLTDGGVSDADETSSQPSDYLQHTSVQGNGFTLHQNAALSNSTSANCAIYEPRSETLALGKPEVLRSDETYTMSTVEAVSNTNTTTQFSEVETPLPTRRSSIVKLGLGLYNVDLGAADGAAKPLANIAAIAKESGYLQDDDDDMYFDDGLIAFGEDDGNADLFDESVFDKDDTDEYGRPLPSFSSIPSVGNMPVSYTQPSESSNLADETSTPRKGQELPKLRLATTALRSVTFEVQPPMLIPGSDDHNLNESMSLTQDTLDAYQIALAAAAQQAAAIGRFDRGGESWDDAIDQLSHLENDNDADDFDYDDTTEDDDIIAEANAEALASDQDGFYGQEFDFYPAPAAGDARSINGGFFGTPGKDGLHRSKSGRSTREPNLTPITERSEYSNRNSLMSIPPVAGGMLSSPGLAQLVAMGDSLDDNMSLEALLRARRGAWGGSQASLKSSTNGEGSPLTAIDEDQSDMSVCSPTAGLGKHTRRGSAISVGLSSHSGESAPESPTLTMASGAARVLQAQPAANSVPMSANATFTTAPAALSPGLQNTPVSPQYAAGGMLNSQEIQPPMASGQQKIRGHRHTGSADSICYVKEDDPVGGERWVLERRRTGENGEVEVLGRQVIEGGTI